MIYVGKTDSSFSIRIACHRKEEAFAPYLSKAQIYVSEVKDAKEADFLETVLINQYRPELNCSKKNRTSAKVYACLDWLSWDEYCVLMARPKSQGKPYAFYLSPTSIKKLDKAAKQLKCSKSKALDLLIQKYL